MNIATFNQGVTAEDLKIAEIPTKVLSSPLIHIRDERDKPGQILLGWT
jgi:hypothetical protein